MIMADLDFFFNPKTIAIIGASDSMRFGYTTTKYLLNSKFKTFPVHLYKKEILGYPAFKSIKDIPEEIELAIILVSNKYVLQAVQECIDKGVKGIIIESAGFAETRKEKFIKMQDEIADLINSSSVRVIGPNCVGLTNFHNEFSSSDIDFKNVPIGNISIIAQSGVLGNVFVDWGAGQNMGFSKAITLGNKIDVDEVDMLDFLNDDEDTKAIALYLEGTKRGEELKSVLKRMKKPIIVLKNGRSEIGSNAVKSHTASIAGNDKIYDALFKQNPRILRVDNFYEMFDIAHIFSTQPLPKGKNIAVITGSGSLGILACDNIVKQGLFLAQLSDNTLNKIKAVIPDWVSIKGTIDLGPSMLTSFLPSLDAIMRDPNVHCLLFIFCVPKGPLQQMKPTFAPYFKMMNELSKEYKIPCICACFGSRWVFDFVSEAALKFNIPVIDRIENAIKAFRMMYDYASQIV